MAWWAVYLESGRELRTRGELTSAGVRALCPFERVTERVRAGRRWKLATSDRPLFRRYLFVEDAAYDDVAKARGVVSVLRDGAGDPLVVPAREMRELLSAVELGGDDDGLVSAIDRTRLSLGFHAKVGSFFSFLGALSGAQGRVVSLDHLDDRGEVDVELQIFGTTRSISVPYGSVGSIASDLAGGRRIAAAVA